MKPTIADRYDEEQKRDDDDLDGVVSDEAHEILSAVPHWLIRGGITAIFGAVASMLALAWLIRFPDVISTRVTVTTQTPPVDIIANVDGRLVHIFVEDEDIVAANTALAIIDNPARAEDVFYLQRELPLWESCLNQPDTLLQLVFSEQLRLGEIQLAYSSFLSAVQRLRFFSNSNYHFKKIGTIKSQSDFLRNVRRRLLNQNQFLRREVEIADSKFKSDKHLFRRGLISETELRRSESVWLQKKLSFESAQTSVVNTEIQLSEYEKAILDLNQDASRGEEGLISDLMQSFKSLQSQTALWEQKYLLRAPVPGTVSFFEFWSDNQFVKRGAKVMTIVPESEFLIGKAFLSGFGSGKISRGQKVNIKFDSFPVNEFGLVLGVVESISQVAHDNRLALNIGFPTGLKTSYNKELGFKHEMQGTAEIITEDLRLLERIFNNLRSLLRNSGA